MWNFVEEPWQYRLLDCLPPSIDLAQLERARAMTPAERIAAAEELMEVAEALRKAVADAKART
jgi:hypothetical protein